MATPHVLCKFFGIILSDPAFGYGRGPAQDVPFDLIHLLYSENNSCLVGIGPIHDIELKCIF